MALLIAILLAMGSTANAFDCPGDGQFADPTDCAKFYKCAGGSSYSFTCPQGLLFDSTLGQCNWAANVKCDTVPGPSPNPTISPKPTQSPVPGPTGSPAPNPSDLMVVCYFPNWAGYRLGQGTYTPNDIDPNLCTHVNYAFAVLDSQTFKIKAFDSWADIDKGFYKQTVDLKLKNPNLKVLIAIGGWTDSSDKKYSNLVADPNRRREFISDVIQFMKKYKFDGLDLDWEYPGCPQGQCGGSPSDKANFAIFAQELRAAFDKERPRFLLSAAVGSNRNIVENSYNVPVLANALDYINVMAYDFHGPWESTTGQNAPFRPYAGSDATLTVEATLKYWVQKGAPSKKLIVGIPIYGKSFTLADPSNTNFNAPARGAGEKGQFTSEPGLLAYYEICSLIKNYGWTKKSDANAGPYAFKGNQWVGYDDPQTAEMKARYAKENNYGGAMVWDIAMDDFHSSCCGVKNPILAAINYGLFGKGKSASSMTCA